MDGKRSTPGNVYRCKHAEVWCNAGEKGMCDQRGMDSKCGARMLRRSWMVEGGYEEILEAGSHGGYSVVRRMF